MGNVDDSIDDIFNRAAESVSSRIVMDKRVYGGAPCVAGTRVPVYAILELMEAGFSHKKILKSFPAVGQQRIGSSASICDSCNGKMRNGIAEEAEVLG